MNPKRGFYAVCLNLMRGLFDKFVSPREGVKKMIVEDMNRKKGFYAICLTYMRGLFQ